MDLAPLLALLPHLGLNAEHVLAWVTIAMTAATVIAKVLDYLVPRLTAYATTTPQAWDDRLAARLAWVLGFLHAILPRVAVGPRPTKPVDPRGTAAIVLLLAIGLAGCGGSALRYHVSIAEGLDAAIAADAEAYELRVQRATVAAVTAECTDPEGFEDCRKRVARATADRFDRWEASHNASAEARDLYVAALRDSTAENPDLSRLLDEALDAVVGLVEAAKAFGADIDIADLLELIR
jgi:hypothetical protein